MSSQLPVTPRYIAAAPSARLATPNLHRRWVDIKSAITGKDDQAVLNECERGEDVAKKSYKRALEKDLPPEIRQVVQRQYDGVLRNHDQVKALRDQTKAS